MEFFTFDIQTVANLASELLDALKDSWDEQPETPANAPDPVAMRRRMDEFVSQISRLEDVEQAAEIYTADELTALGDLGLQLADQLSDLIVVLEKADLGEPLARLYPSLGIWLARNGATINHLEGIANSLAALANFTQEPEQLVELCGYNEEIVEAAASQAADVTDARNRPWRAMNLNQGVMACRAHDIDLMRMVFDRMLARIPGDMPQFLLDGVQQMKAHDFPEHIQNVMQEYYDKHARQAIH